MNNVCVCVYVYISIYIQCVCIYISIYIYTYCSNIISITILAGGLNSARIPAKVRRYTSGLAAHLYACVCSSFCFLKIELMDIDSVVYRHVYR